MAKQLNVNLAFTADTGKAKTQIQELQSLLNQISHQSIASTGANMSNNITQAANAAKELQYHLNNAFNATTGRFDLSMLDKSLRTSKSNISDLSTQLLSAGSTGQQAFLKLAQSISLADQPMLRISNRMREFGTVMKNTIKWQLSSSMIHGFMGAISSAYGYAQDLNASLNDIRIVTGQSVDEMARFAEQANKAAKSLSTTTTDYTKASLIYYQQGLSDSEVAARTDVTIKMANAAGQSAQTVSDQLTAVWNNFYDGSKSLEYYADVMTALGAATASSTDEISQGLQKFAAVAETVGLSYEYATAALATITSNTRESADVVGTALKTLFARIQGLQLGETLDDGTNLNKYSQALAKVGISIYESNGELKAMDNILNEMAAKWDTMNAAQQTALAQTVAGVRQYTQLVALMENWNNGDGDSFQANLRTIAGAEGTLDQQAEIYAQSWEAAEKRVRASAESIYQSILDDKFFISLNNGFANALTGINAFIKGLGGVKPLIGSIAAIFMSNFAHKIPQALDNLKYNFQMLIPNSSQKAYTKIQTDMNAATQKAFQENKIDKNSSMGYAIEQANQLTAARSKLALVSNQMSEAERQAAQTTLSIISAEQAEITALKQKNEELEKSISLRVQSSSKYDAYDTGFQQGEKFESRLGDAGRANLGFDNTIPTIGAMSGQVFEALAQQAQNAFQQIQNGSKQFSDTVIQDFKLIETANLGDAFDKIKTKIQSLGQGANIEPLKKDIIQFINSLGPGISQIDSIKKALQELEKSDSSNLLKNFEDLRKKLNDLNITGKELGPILQAAFGQNIGPDLQTLINGLGEADQRARALEATIAGFNPAHVVRTSEALGALGGMAGSAYSLIRSVSSAVQALENPDMSGWEKFTTVLMSVSMIIPAVSAGIRSLGTLYGFYKSQVMASVMAMELSQVAGIKDVAMRSAIIAAKTAELLAGKKATDQIGKEVVAKLTAMGVDTAALGITKTMTVAKLSEAMGWNTSTTAILGSAKAMGAFWAAIWPVALILAIVTAAVIAFVAAWKHFYANSPEGKLDKARESVQGLKNSLEEAEQAAQDLNSAFERYNTAVDALNQCTEGTEEWYAALKKVNDEVLAIIAANPALASSLNVIREDNGVLRITNQDDILNAANERVDRAQQALAMGNIQLAQAEANVEKERLIDDMKYRGTYDSDGYQRFLNDNYMWQVSQYTEDGMYVGETDYSYDPTVLIDKYASEIGSAISPEEIMDIIAGDLPETMQEWMKQDIVESLYAFRDSIKQIADGADEVALRLENTANIIAEQELGEEFGGAEKEIASEAYENLYEQIYNDVVEDGKSFARTASANNATVKDLWERYSEATGTNYKLDSNAVTGNKDNRFFQYWDGEKVAKVSLEQVAAAIAASEALDGLGIAANQAAEILSNIKLPEDSPYSTEDVHNYIANKNFESMTGTAFAGIGLEDKDGDGQFSRRETVTNEHDGGRPSSHFDYSNEDAVYDFFGGKENLDALVMAELGITDASVLEEYIEVDGEEVLNEKYDENLYNQFRDLRGEKIDDFYTAAENYQHALDDIDQRLESSMSRWFGDDLNTEQYEAFQTFLDQQFNVDQQAQAVQLLSDAYLHLGKDGVSSLQEILLNAGDDAGKLMEILANIDWSSPTALQDLNNLLIEQGIDVDSLGGSWDNYIAKMADATNHIYGVVDALNELRGNLSDTKDIIDDLKTGDIISDEDYEFLLSQNKEIADLFSMTSDGWVFVGTISDLNDKLGDTQQALEDIQEEFTTASDIGKTLSGDSWVKQNEEGWDNLDWETQKTTLAGLGALYGGNEDFWQTIGGGSEEALMSALEYVNNENNDPESAEYAAQQQIIDDFFTQMGRFMSNYENGMFESGNVAELYMNQANNSYELNQMADSLETGDARANADNINAITDSYIRLGSQYDECATGVENLQDAQEKYNETLESGTEEEVAEAYEDLIDAQKDLDKQLKKAEWDNFTDKALEAAQALEDCTDASEISKNLKTIQQAFQDAFGMDVPLETLEKFKDDFIAWGNATEEESDDIATHIMSKINAENFDMGAFEQEMSIVVDAETDPAVQALWNLSMTADQIKGFIESNPPTVHADGTADFSAMVAEMLAAGATAADVAAALAMIGQTNVDFSAWGNGLGTYDFSDPESVFQFTKDLSGWQANIESNGDASGANVIQKAFPGGNIPTVSGTGGGRHSGGSGGGGGGGGGSKPKKAQEVKKSDIVERYKEINDTIDDLTEKYDNASEAADRMYGNERIKQMEKVNKLLKDEIGLIEKKKEEAQAYLQEDRDTLNQAASEAGVSFDFDANGNIANYTTEMTKLFEELDSTIKSANADGDATEDEQEAINKIQERIDKVTEAIQQYDETKELIEDLDNDIQEKLYEIYDNELEAFEYKVELDLELSEDSMKIIEFQLGQIEDDAFKAAESIALTSQKAENLYDTLMTNRNALDEAFGLSDIAWDLGIMQEGQEFTEDQIDLMKEYRDNIMDVIEEISELRETVEEQVMEVFEAWNDKLETNMDTLDHFGSMLDSYKNIVDIVGQDTMGLSEGFMQGIQEASVEHALDQMHATKEAYETMMSARLRAEQALEDARARGDDASAKMWEETLTELNSNMESAQEDMLSSWENALSVIQDNFEATVERVVETFNNAVYAFGGMEGLSNEFSRQKEMADLMVDDYQKIYELSKLNRNIQKTLDDTDVIAGKQKLLKLQEKINALEEEGVELSQYDLEYLQAEYELRMAEIELANAQAKKDTVRLSKDNEGNWSYIYTTSVDAVDEAHQKYEDALYAMQELSSNYVDEMSEQLISTSQEMAEALAEVRASDFASQEDYEKELDRIRKMYQERLDQQEVELQKSINNNKDLYTQDWTNYHEATGYKISDTENFVTSFKDSMLGTLMQSESDTANFNNIMSSAVDILTTGLVDAATTYYLHMEQAMQAAGTSTNDFATDMQENIDTVVQKSEEGAAAIEDMAEKMASAFWDISDSVNQWQEGYGSAMQQVIDSNLAVVESFNNMLKELSIDPDAIKVEYDISTDYGLENASSMDTGGYTGTWGTAGKLAILHEKELVLNPDDTSNFLQAIGISKTLLETIDLNAKQASNGMGLLSAAGFRDSSNGTLEQNVHIEATFPNVTDHNEIEEAMKNLVNTASQYANRK